MRSDCRALGLPSRCAGAQSAMLLKKVLLAKPKHRGRMPPRPSGGPDLGRENERFTVFICMIQSIPFNGKLLLIGSRTITLIEETSEGIVLEHRLHTEPDPPLYRYSHTFGTNASPAASLPQHMYPGAKVRDWSTADMEHKATADEAAKAGLRTTEAMLRNMDFSSCDVCHPDQAIKTGHFCDKHMQDALRAEGIGF
jgi:hypothetical protein